LPFRRCHAFRFRPIFLKRIRARPAVSLFLKRTEIGRVTVSGFEKKAMKSPMFMREATDSASVRHSSVLKMGNFFGKGIL
jgi:hypothetical protein